MRAQRVTVASAVVSLLIPGVAALPAVAAPDVHTGAVTPVPNPVIAQACGLDATLVLDASGSISSEGAVDKVRSAGNAFVKALKDTKSTARITQFGTFSDQLAPRTVVDAASTAATGALTKAMNKYYNPIPPKPSDSSIYQYRGGSWTNPNNYAKTTASNANQWTNWDAGMDQARTETEAPEIILFVTDGDPTAFNLNTSGDPHYGNGKNVAVNTGSGDAANPTLDRAIQQANAAKDAKTRIMVVGVGPAVTKPGSDSVKRMEKISGPQVVQDKDLSSITSINQIDVALVKDFDSLASFLRQVVSDLCTPSMTIRKLAQTADNSGYEPYQGWNMTVQPTVNGGFDWILPDTTPASQKSDLTDVNGYSQFQWEPRVRDTTSDALVSEDVKAGYSSGRPGADNDWICEKRTPDDGNVEVVKGDFADPQNPRFNLSVGPRNIVTCSLYNSFQYRPGIALTKSVIDAVDVSGRPTVRGNADGWNVKYRFEVENTGNTPLSGVTVADGKCDSKPTRTQGTGDRLQPGDTWTYECPRLIRVPTSTNPDLTLVNTAYATGSAPDGTVASDSDSATVWIKTPAMSITKTPRETPIPAGGLATYDYALTNTGNDPIKDVGVVDNKCAPLEGPTGDGATSGVLDIGETWTYTCKTRLYETTRNTATATGKWSQATPGGQNNSPVTSTDDAIVDVIIPAYITVVKSAVPENGTPFDYTASGTGLHPDDEAFTLTPGDPRGDRSRTLVVEPAAVGTEYTIDERDTAGWSLEDITCEGARNVDTDPSAGEAKVTVKPGDTATCTYSNERLGSLTIRKIVHPQSSSQRFDFTATGVTPTGFSLGNEEEQVFSAIPKDTDVSVAETALDDWALSSITCDGGPVVSGNGITWTAENATDAVCTFVNRAIPKAELTVVKVADPVSGDFDYTAQGRGVDEDFTLSPTSGDPSPSKRMTVSPVPGGSQYTVTETPQADWTLNALTCRVSGPDGLRSAPVFGNTDTGEVQVTLKPGESGVCTYNNERKSTLTIKKNVSVPVTDPDAKDQVFDFTAAGVSPTDFALQDYDKFDSKQVFERIPANTDVAVSEVLPAGWTMAGIECSAPQGQWSVSGERLDIRMGAGQDITCAFTNAKTPPDVAVLEVVKLADPANGTPFGFRVQGDRVDEQFTLDPPTTTSQTLTLDPAVGGTTYTVAEDPVAGWDQRLTCAVNGTDVVGSALTLLPGDAAVCTAVNVKRGSLTIVKQTDPPDSPQSFDFTATNKPDFSLTDGESQTFDNVQAGTAITVTEASDDLWVLQDIVCTDGSTPDLDAGSVDVTIGAGEDVVCTFVNSQLPPAFIATVKIADPEQGSFPFTLTGGTTDESFTLNPPDTIAEVITVRPPVSGVSYTMTEQPVTGWDLRGTACWLFGADGSPTADSGSDPSVSQVVKPGEFWVCGFLNRKQAQFTVAKSAQDARGQLFDFAWNQQPATFTLGDGDSRKATGLPAGTQVGVTETKPPFWTLESIVCDGTRTTVDDIDLDAGEAQVSLGAGGDGICTYVNTRTIYNPQMELSKTPSPIEVLPNGEVTYTYDLKNVGDIALQPMGGMGGIVVDDKCSPVTYTGSPDAQLEPDDTWTFSCTTTLTEDTENTATATLAPVNEPAKELEVTDVAFVPVLAPEIKVVKSADRPVVYTGDDVTYTYAVTNPGQVPLADVTVTDDLCSPVTGPDAGWDRNTNGLLDPLVEEQTWHCADTLTRTTTNTGTATGTPTLPNQPPGAPVTDTDKATVRVLDPSLSVTKTPSARGGTWNGDVYQVASNTPVTFTYRVENTGDAPLDLGPGVQDDKCAPVEYVSGDDGSGLIQPGQTWVYECVTTPVGTTTVTNVATVTGVEPEVGGRFEASDDATVQSFESGIAIKKSANKQVVEPGTPVTYTYSVINTGETVLSDVRVTDDKCSPVTYASGDTNKDGKLDLDETWVFTCTTPLQRDTVNVAEARGVDPGGHEVTDAAAARVLVIGGELTPAITVEKTPSATRVPRGSKVTYTYEVSNVGTMPLANIRVTDDKCAPVTYVKGDDNGDGLLTAVANGESYPDEAWTYTCTADIARDTTNTVVAEGAPWAAGQIVGTDVSAQDKATVTVSIPKLPIDVDVVKKKKYPSGKYTTLIKRSKTNPQGKLRYRTLCRPVKAKAAGDVSFCRVKVSKKGRVKVKIMGYRKVRVTVWIRATPKPKYTDDWRDNRWKKTWTLRARKR